MPSESLNKRYITYAPSAAGSRNKTQTHFKSRSPVMAQWLTNPTRNHEVAGSVPALAQWVNDPALP